MSWWKPLFGSGSQITLLNAGDDLLVHTCDNYLWGIWNVEYYWFLSRSSAISETRRASNLDFLKKNLVRYKGASEAKYQDKRCFKTEKAEE